MQLRKVEHTLKNEENCTAVSSLPIEMFHIKALNELLIINIRKSSYTSQTEENTYMSPSPAAALVNRRSSEGTLKPGHKSHTDTGEPQAPLRKECTKHIRVYFLFFF